MEMRQGHAQDLIVSVDHIDLVVTDPPYAFGGNGQEHELAATVATVLRESARRLKRGSWMVVFCASSWRSISYMTEAVRGLLSPVRIATWTKPKSKTKVQTCGWKWASVSVIAMRKGPKNRHELGVSDVTALDHISAPPVINGRRAELPEVVCDWAVTPYAIDGGVFLDPFAGSGALVLAAERRGMLGIGLELGGIIDPGAIIADSAYRLGRSDERRGMPEPSMQAVSKAVLTKISPLLTETQPSFIREDNGKY